MIALYKGLKVLNNLDSHTFCRGKVYPINKMDACQGFLVLELSLKICIGFSEQWL